MHVRVCISARTRTYAHMYTHIPFWVYVHAHIQILVHDEKACACVCKSICRYALTHSLTHALTHPLAAGVFRV